MRGAGALRDIMVDASARRSDTLVDTLAHHLADVIAEAPTSSLATLAGTLAHAQAMVFARLASTPEPSEQESAALSPQTIAYRLDLPLSKVYHLLRAGQLRAAKVGKYWRVAPAELTAYLKQETR